MTTQSKDAEKLRLDAARWWILSNQPFYGRLTMRLRDDICGDVIQLRNRVCRTATTNGKQIKWARPFIQSLTDPQLRFVLLHETLHCAHLHMWRLPATEDGNKAGDYAINRVLTGIAGIEAPPDALLDPAFDGLCEEEILHRLPAKPQGDAPTNGGDLGGCTQGSGDDESDESNETPDEDGDSVDPDDDEDADDDDESGTDDDDDDESPTPERTETDDRDSSDDAESDGSDESDDDMDDESDGDESDDADGSADDPSDEAASNDAPTESDSGGWFEDPDGPDPREDPEGAALAREQLRDEWETAVVQAGQLANRKGAGELPGDLQRQIERLHARPVDWKRECADFVKTAIGERNNWMRPARRHAWQRVIYPSKMHDQLGQIVFVRDTSGSVDEKMLALCSAVVTQAMRETQCSGIVLDVDSRKQNEFHLNVGDECPLAAIGGGGTKFAPAFARVRELQDDGEEIAGIIYITDMEASDWPLVTDPGIPTLWLSTSPYEYTAKQATFGHVVKVEEAHA